MIVQELTSEWLVYLAPFADGGKRRFGRLPAFVTELEKAGERRLDVEPEDLVGDWETRAHDLGIAHASRIGPAVRGTIHVHIDPLLERSAGFVGEMGDPIAAWVGTFLKDERPDVLVKVQQSNAPERHAFVLVPPVGFTTTAFAISELLMRREDLPLPVPNLQLPAQVTNVWVGGMWRQGAGCQWGPDIGWARVVMPPANG